MQKQKTSSTEELYGELGRAFNFTRGDLEANRAGFISARQKGIQWRKFYSMLYLIISVSMLYLTIAAFIQFSTNDAEEQAGIFWIMIAFVLVIVSLVAWGLGVIQTSLDLASGRIQSIVGDARIETRSFPKQGERPYFIIGKLERPLARRSSLILKPYPYRVYFMPKSKTILSVEEALPEEISLQE